MRKKLRCKFNFYLVITFNAIYGNFYLRYNFVNYGEFFLESERLIALVLTSLIGDVILFLVYLLVGYYYTLINSYSSFHE